MLKNQKHLNSILKDKETWLFLVATLGFAADAAAEGILTPFRIITIVAMTALLFMHVRSKLSLQRAKDVPFLIVAGKSDEQYRNTMTLVEAALPIYNLNIQLLEKTYGLYHEDWIYHRESLLPPELDVWHDTVTRIERKFWRMAANMPGRKIYHLFMDAPAALCVGLGATIGSRNQFLFYQYFMDAPSTPYQPVISFSNNSDGTGPHILKSRVEEFKYIETTGLEKLGNAKKNQELLVAVCLAGHDPTGEVQKHSEITGYPVVAVKSCFRGTIPIKEDWVRLSQEVCSVLLTLAGTKNISRLHLFLSTPVCIAFCIGSALGKFVSASIYNNRFEGQKGYHEILRLEEL